MQDTDTPPSTHRPPPQQSIPKTGYSDGQPHRRDESVTQEAPRSEHSHAESEPRFPLDEDPWELAGRKHQIWRRTVALIGIDALALLMSAAVGALLAGSSAEGTVDILLTYRLGAAATLLAILCYAIAELYNAIPPPPPEETRTLVTMTTVAFGGVATAAGLMSSRTYFVLFYLGLAWMVAMLAVPLCRAFLRHLCAHRSWWQRPVVVLGAGPRGCSITRTLVSQPSHGLRPVALFDDDPERHGGTVEGVPVIGFLAQATYFSQKGIPYAIAELPSTNDQQRARQLEFCTSGFQRVLFIPENFSELPNRWARAQAVGGMLGLELRRRLHSRWRHRLKRIFDIIVASILLVGLLPLGLLVALLIKLDSEGPVFYRQSRLGSGGRLFQVIKFRSMRTGADERLQELLEKDPEARAEYERFQKLKDDPRVTRVGRVLRGTSLDELPQLWNVLKGDMSLVGPRAYLPDELSKMKRLDNLILRSTPGLTGLWQVSGRNELSFETRVELEASYVRNWSLFFDLYLLIRTIPVVLLGRGAQ